ncbi:coiled-coil domain-containing protein 43 isoform X2 [Haemorhous mexicanus]|uniref:coiled-coil domain-containing protein 43 isoform X2 n=1 Tax=Haemorhous mexicanus TaxID=30427 RepID=UPI0028BF25D8|nr:coiled-coil domain-containing protein 43 isoform X2 [Haemorhous mexicanus]
MAAAQGHAAPGEAALREKERLCQGRRWRGAHTGHTEHTGPPAQPHRSRPGTAAPTPTALPPLPPAPQLCPAAAAVPSLCRPKMAAPGGAGAAPMAMAIPIPAPILLPEPPPFPAWLAARLDALGLDRAVYGAYIEGLLREEESDEERLEALRAVLAACLEEDLLNDVCREVVERWSVSQVVDSKEEKEDEVQAIASMMEKQARIVVKPKEVSQEEKQRKAALLAQYANVTDEEDGGDEQDGLTAAVNIGSEKCILCIPGDSGCLAGRQAASMEKTRITKVGEALSD